MPCKFCNAKKKAGHEYCPRCGAVLDEKAAVKNDPLPEPEPEPEPVDYLDE